MNIGKYDWHDRGWIENYERNRFMSLVLDDDGNKVAKVSETAIGIKSIYRNGVVSIVDKNLIESKLYPFGTKELIGRYGETLKLWSNGRSTFTIHPSLIFTTDSFLDQDILCCDCYLDIYFKNYIKRFILKNSWRSISSPLVESNWINVNTRGSAVLKTVRFDRNDGYSYYPTETVVISSMDNSFKYVTYPFGEVRITLEGKGSIYYSPLGMEVKYYTESKDIVCVTTMDDMKQLLQDGADNSINVNDLCCRMY